MKITTQQIIIAQDEIIRSWRYDVLFWEPGIKHVSVNRKHTIQIIFIGNIFILTENVSFYLFSDTFDCRGTSYYYFFLKY